jgi:hypothetical protein
MDSRSIAVLASRVAPNGMSGVAARQALISRGVTGRAAWPLWLSGIACMAGL